MSFQEKCFNAAGIIFTACCLACIFSLAFAGVLAPIAKLIVKEIR